MKFFFSPEVDMQLGRRRMQIELGMHALTGHVDTRADDRMQHMVVGHAMHLHGRDPDGPTRVRTCW